MIVKSDHLEQYMNDKIPQVLIVSGCQGLLDLLWAGLLPHGLALRTEGDAELALESVTATPPDLLVLDLDLGAQRSLELARAARRGAILVNSDENTVRESGERSGPLNITVFGRNSHPDAIIYSVLERLEVQGR